MKLSEILSISGKPGLFTVVSQTNYGLIAESVVDKKRMPVFASHQVSILDDISLYTEDDTLPMYEVMKRLYEHEDGKASIDHKASKVELEAKMETVFPEYDRDRVYQSDLKKLFRWYNLIIQYQLWTPEDIEDEESKEKSIDLKKEEKTQNHHSQKSAGKTGGSKAQATSMNSKKG